MTNNNLYTIVTDKIDKVIQFKTPLGKEICVTREVYRDNQVPCGIEGCPQNKCLENKKFIGASPCVVIPDGNILLNYWEIFEFPEIKNIILSYSSLCYVQQCNRKLYRQIKKALNDASQSIFIFENEFCTDCCEQQIYGESTLDYISRLNTNAAHWYSNHISGDVKIVLLTDNKTCQEILTSKNNVKNVHKLEILNVSDYLKNYYESFKTAHLLYESLEASILAKKEESSVQAVFDPDKKNENSLIVPQEPKDGDEYPNHLLDSALMAGIQSKQFLKGVIRVSKFRPITEATVSLTDQSVVKHMPDSKDSDLGGRSEVLVQGMLHRNRAVDGDIVAIRILPRSMWRSSNVDASEADKAGVVDVEPTEGQFRPVERSNVPCGFIVGVFERKWREYVCSIVKKDDDPPSKSSNQWILATPWDSRVPRIRIQSSHIAELMKERFIVHIDRWESHSKYPTGHFVRSLGPIGELETETQTILHEHNLGVRAFTQSILNELEPLSKCKPWKIDSAELAVRRDLRSPSLPGASASAEDLLIFSIDPPGCEDVDDALSVKRLSNGDIQLGVHIADVTHFVQPGSFVDLEARRRSTSVYMADRRYDMIPSILSGDICSLWSGRDRYAFSVIWELDGKTCEVKNKWFGKTVIRSRYKMSYEIAQKIYDLHTEKETLPADEVIDHFGGKEEIFKTISELKQAQNLKTSVEELRAAIRLLVFVATTIKARRLERGGLELESIEINVKFENQQTRSGNIECLLPKDPMLMHWTVAELMIFANHWVARKCMESFPDRACLRRHPAPKQEHFEELILCAKAKGFELNPESNKQLSESLDKAHDKLDPDVNNILRQFATRAMTHALYFSTGQDNLTVTDFAHYGLALTLYTHFTSPIRRYADILVHRVLMAALEKSGETPSGCVDPAKGDALLHSSELNSVCQHMNDLHWSAQRAQRCSMEFFQARYFNQLPADSPMRYAEGIICQLRGSNGFSVLISKFGIQGNAMVKYSDGRVAWCEKKKKELPYTPVQKETVVTWMTDATQFETERVKNDSDTYGHIVVRKKSSGEEQEYRLFDHVRILVEVADSVAHGMGLKLSLCGKLPAVSESTSNRKRQLESTMDVDAKPNDEIFMSVREDEKRRMEKEAMEGDDVSHISSLHDSRSLYWKIRKTIPSE